MQNNNGSDGNDCNYKGCQSGCQSNNLSYNQDFCSRFKKMRDKTGLSQVALAKKIGVSKNTIQSYENGTLPKGGYLLKISDVFQCSLDWLITGKGPQYIDEKIAYKATVDGNENPPIDFEQAVLAEHYEVIKKFKNNERAKRFNEKLVRLEQLSDKLFDKAESHIDQLIETAEIIVGEQQTKQNGRVVGQYKEKKKHA